MFSHASQKSATPSGHHHRINPSSRQPVEGAFSFSTLRELPIITRHPQAMVSSINFVKSGIILFNPTHMLARSANIYMK